MFETLLITATLFGSVLLTGLLRFYALNRKLLDVPNRRSSHSAPTPRGGGLSIVICVLAAGFALYYSGRVALSEFNAVVLGGLLVGGIGFWDDHRSVAPKWRILIHFIAAALLMHGLEGFPDIQIGSSKIALGFFGFVVGTVFVSTLR